MTLFVGPSIWRSIDVRTMGAMMTAMINAPQTERVIWAPIWNDALIGRSRSIMCTEFLKTDADVMIIIDDDIVFDPADFWKIVEGARDTRGIYGGAYVTRSTEPHLTSRSFADGQEQIFAAGPVRRPIEYQYLATGFWAVHRDVMESMIGAEFQDAYGVHKIEEVALGADRPFYPFFSPFVAREDDGRLHYLSEDWAYSNRARQLGHKVWVDLSIILQHMGLYPYTVRDLKTLAEPGLPSTGIDVVEAFIERTPTGDPLIDTLTEDIAEWSDDDVGDIRRGIIGAVDMMNSLWEKRERDGISEAEWYRSEETGLAYILDLAGWHLRGGGHPAGLAHVVSGKRLLDYGGGIGTFAMRAARAGADVTLYEPNELMRTFAYWRAVKHGLSLGITDGPVGMYDAISCWHVFEHLEDPEAALRQIRAMLAPGGLLITQSGFHDQYTASHHGHPDWESVLRANGFAAVDDYPDVYRLVEVAEAVLA